MSLPQMSVYGAVLIAVIVVVRFFLIHRLPKRVFVLLWGIVLLRLLVPLSVSVPVSVYSLVPAYAPVESAAGALEMTGIQAKKDQPLIKEGAAEPVQKGFQAVSVFTVIWLAGMLSGTIFFLTCYVRCWREFGMSLPVGHAFAARWREEHRHLRAIQIRQSDRISAPLTYGILRPVILVPKNMDWDDEIQASCVLLHEYIHICHLDALWKLFAAAALCIHWFNPMVWLMYVLFNKDIELACDECVVRRLDGDARSTYARALIAMEEKKSGLQPLYNSFSRNAIEERIMEIMRAKKITLGITVASMALIAVIAGMFATSAKADDVPKQDAVADNSGEMGEPDTTAAGAPAGADEPGTKTAASASAGAGKPGAAGIGDGNGPGGNASAGVDVGNAAGGNAAAGSGSENRPGGNATGSDNGNGTEKDGTVRADGSGNAAAQKSDGEESSAKQLVYIKSFDDGWLVFDKVEWVVVPSARAQELGIGEEDGPGGFYVYNGAELLEELPVAADCVCTLLDWKGNYASMKATPEKFKQILEGRREWLQYEDKWLGIGIPYWIRVEHGAVISIVEQYVP